MPEGHQVSRLGALSIGSLQSNSPTRLCAGSRPELRSRWTRTGPPVRRCRCLRPRPHLPQGVQGSAFGVPSSRACWSPNRLFQPHSCSASGLYVGGGLPSETGHCPVMNPSHSCFTPPIARARMGGWDRLGQESRARHTEVVSRIRRGRGCLLRNKATHQSLHEPCF